MSKYTSEEASTRDLKKKNKSFADNVRSCANSSTSLAWYRGHQSGVFDASKVLEDLGHPRIATKLRRKFAMDVNGAIRG